MEKGHGILIENPKVLFPKSFQLIWRGFKDKNLEG
jgi:hypothetical protein